MPLLFLTIIAQSAPTKGDILPVMGWLGLLIVVTVVGGLVVLALRKRMLAKASPAADEASLMDSLRAMRDRGEMTSEEFEATRRAMIERMKSSLSAKTRSGPAEMPQSGDPARRPPMQG